MKILFARVWAAMRLLGGRGSAPSMRHGASRLLLILQGLAWRLTLPSLVFSLMGCTSFELDTDRRGSYAMLVDREAPVAVAALAGQPDRASSGFRLLPSGAHALGTRLELIRQSRHSLDLQYFILQSDETGKELTRLLRDAASRGVRVRVLVDDLYTAGTEELLLTLSSHENIEVRVFNPFLLRHGSVALRFAAQPFDFERLNHRMHNKLFVADGVAAITGGRNIGDEYFSRRDAGNFIDLDVLAVGHVVEQMQAQFDLYWNSDVVRRIQATAHDSSTIEERRARFDRLTKLADAPATREKPQPDPLGRPAPAEQLRAGRLELSWGFAESYADSPRKGVSADGTNASYGASPMRQRVLDDIRDASKELLLTSPYFIPGPAGLLLLHAAAARGVSVNVLTNSLASTDQPIVHSAYRRYREDLLKSGVHLYELSPVYARREDRRKFFGLSAAGLHTKCLVIDRQELIIGSMNFDPRSAHFNTENGLAIYVPSVSRDAAALLNMAKREAAHRLQLGRDGHIEWIVPVGGNEYEHDQEPDAGIVQRLWLRLISPLAPESLL